MSHKDNSFLVRKDISIPLHRQIKTLILQSINSGEFKANEKIPSEMELAKKFGVSRITTKQALNELTREGIVNRVPGKGTFVCQSQSLNGPGININEAEQMVNHSGNREINNSYSIGLILPYLNDSYLTGIIVGVEKVLRQGDYHLIFRKSDNHREEEARAIEALRAEKIQGLIIFPTEEIFCSDAILKLKLDRFPFVLIDRFYQRIDTNCVISDNFGGAYTAGKYLTQLGHRQIGLISFPLENAVSIEERIRGFNQALNDSEVALPSYRMDLTLDHEHTYDLNTGNVDSKALEIIKGFLIKNPQLTAVFGINDFIAVCILQAALQLGKKVPDDLSIIGFDNNNLAPNVKVPLTTINQPKEELGEQAARLLQEILEKGNVETNKIILSTNLVVRASTAPPKIS